MTLGGAAQVAVAHCLVMRGKEVHLQIEIAASNETFSKLLE